jgi:predicted RNA polymerase sigma factor
MATESRSAFGKNKDIDHAQRVEAGTTDYNSIPMLYDDLIQHFPSAGAVVGLASTLGHSVSPQAGLACPDHHAAAVGEIFQPYWATRAHLLAECADLSAAAYHQAIALAQDAAMKRYLEQKIHSLIKLRAH